jgi:hypothetical protein
MLGTGRIARSPFRERLFIVVWASNFMMMMMMLNADELLFFSPF